jgi:hypothetical protein
MLRKLSVLTLVALVLPVAVLAQTTGKIAGQVTDAETGRALIGASVAVVDTTLGAATDSDGNYFILGLPAGTYTIQAQFIGFQSQTVDSVEISPDYTRELNFELTSGKEGSGVPSIGVSSRGMPENKAGDNQRCGMMGADGNKSIMRP